MTLEVIKENKPKESFNADDIWKSICEITNNSRYVLSSIVLFDFPSSTKLKRSGQKKSIRLILFHNEICKYFIHKFGGRVVKELGDGLLAIFHKPVIACTCSIEIKKILNIYDLSTKIAITSGYVHEITNKDDVDIFGSVVDKCARIEKHLQPNQILIDSISCDIIKTSLQNMDIDISSSSIINLKDFGPTRVFLIH